MAQQMRAASVSVASNIAEGCGRGTIPDYRRFVLQARGSAYELETQTEIAKQVGLMNEADADQLTAAIAEVNRLINGIIRELNSRL